MGATKKMMVDNPEFFGECFRPELHWMEQEYLQSLNQKENESINEIEVDFETVSGETTEKKGSPSVGGSRNYESEIFDNQFIDKVRTPRDV